MGIGSRVLGNGRMFSLGALSLQRDVMNAIRTVRTSRMLRRPGWSTAEILGSYAEIHRRGVA